MYVYVFMCDDHTTVQDGARRAFRYVGIVDAVTTMYKHEVRDCYRERESVCVCVCIYICVCVHMTSRVIHSMCSATAA